MGLTDEATCLQFYLNDDTPLQSINLAYRIDTRGHAVQPSVACSAVPGIRR